MKFVSPSTSFFPFLQIKFGTAKRLVKMQILGQNKKKEIDE